MISMIAAVSSDGVMGVDGDLPFDYKEDMRHFRLSTAGSTVIMGRKTFESIKRPLPKRRNVVVSSNFKHDGVEVCSSLEDALNLTSSDLSVWLIGGHSIYKEGMKYAERIMLTITPDMFDDRSKTYVEFPWINPDIFKINSVDNFSSFMQDEFPNSKLKLVEYIKTY